MVLAGAGVEQEIYSARLRLTNIVGRRQFLLGRRTQQGFAFVSLELGRERRSFYEFSHRIGSVGIERQYVPRQSSERTLARAKNMLRCNVLTQLESRLVLFEDLVRQMLTYGRREDVTTMCRRIEAVTAEDLRDLSRRCVTPKPPTLCVVGGENQVASFHNHHHHFDRRAAATNNITLTTDPPPPPPIRPHTLTPPPFFRRGTTTTTLATVPHTKTHTSTNIHIKAHPLNNVGLSTKTPHTSSPPPKQCYMLHAPCTLFHYILTQQQQQKSCALTCNTQTNNNNKTRVHFYL